MKSIKDILRRKKTSPQKGIRVENDDKTIVKISQNTILSEIKRLSSEDIRNIVYEKNILIVKTTHPAVASEIWKKREKIAKKVNEIAGRESIKKVVTK